MRSWVSSAPPKIGRMSQSSRASKPSKSCEHNCRNTIEHNCRTVPSFENSPLFWSIGYFWSTPGKHLHHRSTDAWLQFLKYVIMRKWKPGRSKAWRSFCLHLSVGGRAMSAPVSRSTWVQLHLLLVQAPKMERKWPLGTNWKITSQLRSKSKSQIQYNLSLNYLFQEPIHLQFTVETVTVYGFWTTGRSQSQSLSFKLHKTLKDWLNH